MGHVININLNGVCCDMIIEVITVCDPKLTVVIIY